MWAREAGIGGDAYRCSFCGIAYSDPTEVVVDPGSGSAICAECFHIAAEEFSRSRADAQLPWRSPCLICGRSIEAQGVDPCHVWITSRDGEKGSSWRAHIACIKGVLPADAPGGAWGESHEQ